jgi:hypothetical protein
MKPQYVVKIKDEYIHRLDEKSFFDIKYLNTLDISTAKRWKNVNCAIEAALVSSIEDHIKLENIRLVEIITNNEIDFFPNLKNQYKDLFCYCNTKKEPTKNKYRQFKFISRYFETMYPELVLKLEIETIQI